jgi:hypothetical protein
LEEVFSIVQSKNGLCWWISANLVVGNIIYADDPHLPRVCDFDDVYLTHLGPKKNWSTIYAYFKKLFLRAPKLCCPPWARRNKTFSSTLDFMILHLVRNECGYFGRHINREVNLEILPLKELNNSIILQNPCSFW